jgi:hypothetical protein
MHDYIIDNQIMNKYSTTKTSNTTNSAYGNKYHVIILSAENSLLYSRTEKVPRCGVLASLLPLQPIAIARGLLVMVGVVCWVQMQTRLRTAAVEQ